MLAEGGRGDTYLPWEWLNLENDILTYFLRSEGIPIFLNKESSPLENTTPARCCWMEVPKIELYFTSIWSPQKQCIVIWIRTLMSESDNRSPKRLLALPLFGVEANYAPFPFAGRFLVQDLEKLFYRWLTHLNSVMSVLSCVEIWWVPFTLFWLFSCWWFQLEDKFTVYLAYRRRQTYPKIATCRW